MNIWLIFVPIAIGSFIILMFHLLKDEDVPAGSSAQKQVRRPANGGKDAKPGGNNVKR